MILNPRGDLARVEKPDKCVLDSSGKMFNQVSKKANSLRSGRRAFYATKAEASYSVDNQGREKLAKDINDANLGPSKDGKGMDVFC